MDTKDIPVFDYSDKDFIFSLDPNLKARFDGKLHNLWDNKMQTNCFRYKLGDLKTKYLPGSYNFVAQLNVKRAVDRRKPQFISSIVMPFDPNLFHFGKVSEKEIIFTLTPKHWEKNLLNKEETDKGTFIINVSPIEECHCLLVPGLENGLPQVLNINSLRLAVESLLISNDRYLRVGFNSLGAYASVNHLHFHLYYLRYNLYLENAPVNHLIGNCYELVQYPAEGFTFQVQDASEVVETMKSVMKLIDFLIKEEIPHNLFFTRGKSFTDENVCSVVRIFVWARTAIYGSKNDYTFNAAVCELAGHIIVKEEDGFETTNEEYIAAVLKEACHDIFFGIRDRVKALYL
ncbi:GDP-D-glucose phosphorylase 1 isoform X2 [Parasteatoda tepidariorum]|uniref:GDP-D-glucose phosphorylase 1 isoform X2 n=1 Tax=Parasteatoda tepidariorum TaxID=114398 RepID=UPI0039BCB4FD